MAEFSVFSVRSLVFLSLLLLTDVLSHESSGITIELPNGEEMCFFEDFEGSRRYIFEYKVLRGGNFDVDVIIESPSGMEVYNEAKKSGDSFVFDISWGAYKFCFNNEFSMISHKIIYFELRPEDHERLAIEGGKKGPSANTQAEESTETIHSLATLIMKHQQNYRLRESRSRYQAEKLNGQVQLYSVIQAVIIVIVGLSEIIILRTFFTDHRRRIKSHNASVVQTPVRP